MEISPEVKKAVCRYCKSKFATGGNGSSTTHLKRHSKICIQKKAKTTAKSRQPTIPFQPSNSNNLFMIPGVRYSNKKMREIIATAIMVHEYPFSVVEDSIWMWAFQYANPDFHKVTHKTARNDCLALFEMEKKTLKKFLKSVSKIILTTNMWKSSHQVVEYMVITGHFIDARWNLQKRVLSFVKVPAPRRVQDGLNTIKDIIFNIRESVKYINLNDARLKAFCVVVEQKRLKEMKLVIDCPTRWNSTFNMFSTTLKFKIAFASYKEKEPHYNYAPSLEEWNQVEKVCKLLEVFNLATHVISGSEYPTANLYLAEVWKVKQILDKEIEDEDLFIREMAVVTSFDKIMSMLCEKEVVSPIKSELQDYLDEGIYVPNTNSFTVLDWWRNNSMKYKILSIAVVHNN
ncbi:zinc finger BED domain-containing protein DAYSLEEPER [Glycine max]|uniref:zinc finger BED domain-containing protein DAYSLEEPER n=1 Tax=Glycine max TaxID=3847 RepID=UPI0007193436|nr:zinc finger BED domain-containing protein DAYSLEEPER [Glycine max]|eukprot:XP_014627847.1 zinc finger BED domain-containing protein DAYSLEEPER [Glycine max]